MNKNHIEKRRFDGYGIVQKLVLYRFTTTPFFANVFAQSVAIMS